MPKKSIMIVDDEPHIVDMLTTFLSIKGYEVHAAYTGESALAMTVAHRPDALLLDLMLPDLEGYEVCRRLRAMPQFANLPVLIVTARTDSTSKQRAEDAGADAYITKPVAMPRLLSELETLLAQSGASNSATE